MLTRGYILARLGDIREKSHIFPQRSAEYAAQEAILVRMLRTSVPEEEEEEKDELRDALLQELAAIMDTPLGDEVRFIQRVEEWKAQGIKAVGIEARARGGDSTTITPAIELQLTLPIFGCTGVCADCADAPISAGASSEMAVQDCERLNPSVDAPSGASAGRHSAEAEAAGISDFVRFLKIAIENCSGQVRSGLTRAGISEQDQKELFSRAKLLVALHEVLTE
ncbi:MAG: hypothetical protein HPY71_03590 [Firmicutes bacterium]|nr:hypothetical protein [Bacillota bacterium]